MSQAPRVAIIGGGPAGMSCALWLQNYELHPVIIEREAVLGGMARRSPYLNEWLLGRAGESARQNADAFARHISGVSVETWLGARPRRLRRVEETKFLLDVTFRNAADRSLPAEAVVIATGTRFNGDEWIASVPNARQMAARGRVHVGAPWAGGPGVEPGSHVAIIGGGDNAFDVGRMLAEKGVRVTVIMRSQVPRARPLMLQRLRRHQSSGMARILAAKSVQSLDDTPSKVCLTLHDGDQIEADHVVLLFGYRPNSDDDWMAELALEQDRRGYLIVDANMTTSCPGVFAVGDVANPLHPCVATAVGSGTMAAREIGRRLAAQAGA
jgi:thioredoxin reductase (NADPH)